MILSPSPCFTISPVTLAPESVGVPVLTESPFPPSSTLSKTIVAPGSPSTEGIRSVVPGSARNCLPPVLKIAYDILIRTLGAGKASRGARLGSRPRYEEAGSGKQVLNEGRRLPPAGPQDQNASFLPCSLLPASWLLSHRVLGSNVPARPLHDQLELIRAQHWIIA